MHTAYHTYHTMMMSVCCVCKHCKCATQTNPNNVAITLTEKRRVGQWISVLFGLIELHCKSVKRKCKWKPGFCGGKKNLRTNRSFIVHIALFIIYYYIIRFRSDFGVQIETNGKAFTIRDGNFRTGAGGSGSPSSLLGNWHSRSHFFVLFRCSFFSRFRWRCGEEMVSYVLCVVIMICVIMWIIYGNVCECSHYSLF